MIVASAIVVQLHADIMIFEPGPGRVAFQLQICMHKIFKSRLKNFTVLIGSETFIPRNAYIS